MEDSEPSTIQITDPEGSTFEATLHDIHNIYILNRCSSAKEFESKTVFSTVTSYPDMNTTAPEEEIKIEKVIPQPMTMMQWHRRLGHLNKADILRLARDPNSRLYNRRKGLTFLQDVHRSKTNTSPLKNTESSLHQTIRANPH